MLSSAKVNKTKIAIVMVAFLFVTTPFYFASAFLDGIVYDFVVWLFGGLVGLCGKILDYGVQHFVVGFTDEFMTPTMNGTINSIWTLVRDMFNITFIFGLVYIGFIMILKSDDSNTRKWLINLVIAAILVNFSLLISKIVIDVTNMTATQLLNAGLNSSPRIFVLDDEDRVSFSESMMQQMKIQTVLTTKDNGATYSYDIQATEQVNNQGKSLGYSMMLMIVFLITAFVFLSAGIMIIIRGAMLLLFMILSPLMFIGFVIPSLMKVTRDYWKEFFARAFFAPIYILLIYISLALFQSINVQAGGIGSVMNAQGFGNAGTVADTFGPLALMIVMMTASLSIAKKLGVEGASTAMSMGNKLQKRATKSVRQAGAFTAAQTGGRAARFASEKTGRAVSRNLQNLQQLEGRTWVGRRVKGLARSNFAQDTVGSGAAAMQNAKFGLKRTREQERKAQNDTNARANRGMNFNRANAPAIDANNPDPQAITNRQQARRQQQAEVRDMSNEEILDIARQDRNRIMSPEFASLLSDSQVKAIRDSGILTGEQSDDLEQRRDEGTFAEITAVLDHGSATTEQLTEAMDSLNRVMSTMSNDRLTGMMRFNDNTGQVEGPLANNAIASRLSSAQIDTLQQTGKASSTQMQQVKDARRDGLITIANNGSLGNPGSPGAQDAVFQDRQRRAMFRNPQDAGKLPVQALSRAPAYVTPRIVEEFVSNNPSRADMDTLRVSLRAHIAANPGEAQQWLNWQNNQNNVMSQRFGNII